MSEPLPIADLVRRIVDGTASDADRDEIRHRIVADEVERQFYFNYIRTHALLSFSAGIFQRRTSEGDVHPRESPISAATGPQLRIQAAGRRRRSMAFAFAAALLLCISVFAIYLVAIGLESDSQVPNSNAPLATLIDSTGNVFFNDDFANPGREYATGSYSIESGSAELLLTSRVGVKLRGRTQLVLHDRMQSTLVRGSASFDCPPEAKGYTVHLPGGARIVDLGTRFSVSIGENDRVSVRVGSGHVQLLRPGAEPQSLTMGQTAERNASSEWQIRSVEGFPSDIAGLRLWLSGDSEVTLDVEGRVAQWSNSLGDIGGGFQAAQTDPDRRPTLVPEAINGEPALRFDGKSDVMPITPSLDSRSRTILVVARPDYSAAQNSTNVFHTGGDLVVSLDYFRDQWSARIFNSGNARAHRVSSAPNPAHDPVVVGLVYDHGAQTLTLVTGSERKSIAGMPAVVTERPVTMTLGAHPALDSKSQFHGDIAELLVYDRALSEAELDRLTAYLESRYALASANPDGATKE